MTLTDDRPRATSFLAHRLRRSNLYFVSLFILSFAVIFLAFWIPAGLRNQRLMGLNFGADFPAFYVAGKILNEYPPERLYDLSLQDQLYHQSVPTASADESLPYANAPFLAEFFRPLAKLPYPVAFLVWLAIALTLYLLGLTLLLRAVSRTPDHVIPSVLTRNPSATVEAQPPLDSSRSTARNDGPGNLDRPVIILLSLSFLPFVMECWLGGQISVLGFILFSLFFFLHSRNLPLLAGAILACALYKPTLLVLFVPMLLIGRQWPSLLGFLLGATIILALSFFALGIHPHVAYFRLMRLYAQVNSSAANAYFRVWKFFDLRAFLRLLPRPLQWPIAIPAFAGAAVVLFILLLRWLRLPRLSPDRRRLVFATTLTWLLVLSLYTPMYDAILLVIAVIITADFLLRRAGALSNSFLWLLVLLYTTPFFTQALARAIGFQPFTLVVAAFGIYQLRLPAGAVVAGAD